MALEDQVYRLALAVEKQGDAAAVREIIRQRDQALADLESVKRQRDMYSRWSDEKSDTTARLGRRIAALQGVITRMKRQRVGGRHG